MRLLVPEQIITHLDDVVAIVDVAVKQSEVTAYEQAPKLTILDL